MIISTANSGTEPLSAGFPRRILPLLPPVVVTVLSLALYYICSAPTISWVHESQDSGDLAACAATLGITHPTGYPLYTLVGWICIKIFFWLEPARAMVIFSVICAAVAIGLIARSAALVICLIWPAERISDIRAAWWGALSASFCVVNPIIWSQATVCEVYAFSLMLQAMIWLSILHYLHSKENRDEIRAGRAMIGIGLILGLIVAHHLVGATVILPLAIILFICPPQRIFGSMLKFAVSIIPGLLLYAYLPIRSAMNPRLDWGNPETLGNFINHVLAGQYRNLVFGVQWNEFVRRIDTFRWDEYWGILPMVLFFAGLMAFIIGPRRCPARSLPFAVVPYVTWILIFAFGYRVSDYEVFLYPLVVLLAMGIAPGFVLVTGYLARISRVLSWLLVILTIVLAGISMQGRYIDMDVSNPELNSAGMYAFRALEELPENSMIITATDGQLFSLMYGITCGTENPVTHERVPPRDDIDLVGSNWVMRRWFVENVRDRYGENGRLKFSPSSNDHGTSLRELIDQNLEYRPVYVSGDVLSMVQAGEGSYEAEASITLYRIRDFIAEDYE